MRRYWEYFKYVARHKWYVSSECFKRGLIWRGIKHDWDKFLPDEFIPYARHFYDADGSKRTVRDKTGYYKPDDTGDPAFDFAWFLHQKRNDHHWQWWVLPTTDGATRILDMSDDAIIEMVCDWIGAGKAQGFFSPPDEPMKETHAWYAKNRDKMFLSETTRPCVEAYMRWIS